MKLNLFRPSSLVTSMGALGSMAGGDVGLGIGSQLFGASLYNKEKYADGEAARVAQMNQADQNAWYASQGLVNPNNGGSASDTQAAVSRATYEDWKREYLPISMQVMNQTTYNNPALVADGVNRVTGAVNSSFDNAARERTRALDSYGIATSPQQGAVASRVDNFNRSLAVVDAATRIRQKLADRNKAIAIGGLPNMAGKDYGGGE